MPTRLTSALVLIGLALGLVLSLGCGRSAPTGSADDPATTAASTVTEQPSPVTQTSEGDGVTVAVTWQGPSAGPVFEVVMDTHTGDLDGYDLGQQAVLRNDQGGEAQPNGWDAPEGGHHREGTLSFPETAVDGSELMRTRKIELVIRDMAGVPERRFEWTL